MEITQQCIVALTWVLKDTLGEELDILEEPVEFFVGGNDLLTRVEEALQGHSVGAQLDLHLEPEEAFGEFDEELLFLEALALFPEGIEEGMSFEGTALPAGVSPEATREGLYTVSQIYPDHVVPVAVPARASFRYTHRRPAVAASTDVPASMDRYGNRLNSAKSGR